MSVTPEQLQEIIDRLPTATSLREIARELGINHWSVKEAARPLVTLMRASGTLGHCPCGKPRFHHGACMVQGLRTAKNVEHRQAIIDMMLEGVPMAHIAGIFNCDRTTIRYHRRFMTDEQRRRHVAISAEIGMETRRSNYRHIQPAGDRKIGHSIDPRLTKALIDGDSYSAINAAFSFSNNAISRAVRKLTPEQRATREANRARPLAPAQFGWRIAA